MRDKVKAMVLRRNNAQAMGGDFCQTPERRTPVRRYEAAVHAKVLGGRAALQYPRVFAEEHNSAKAHGAGEEAESAG
jgi:hypothetical protein